MGGGGTLNSHDLQPFFVEELILSRLTLGNRTDEAKKTKAPDRACTDKELKVRVWGGRGQAVGSVTLLLHVDTVDGSEILVNSPVEVTVGSLSHYLFKLVVWEF